MRTPVICSTVLYRQDGPPLANVALIRSSAVGSATWPGVPVPCAGQASVGTTVSRGKLITTAPLRPGETCSRMIVSERWPPSTSDRPNCLFAPLRVSEPISRIFSALVYFGGRLPSPVILIWWMLLTSSLYTE